MFSAIQDPDDVDDELHLDTPTSPVSTALKASRIGRPLPWPAAGWASKPTSHGQQCLLASRLRFVLPPGLLLAEPITVNSIQS
jgi:hypothetical protein